MMNNICLAIFIITLVYLQFKVVLTKTTIVFYDDIWDCDECDGNKCFELFDFSTVKMILDEDDDTVAYLNGTWKMNVPIKSPTPALAWAEKRYGSKWSAEAFYRRYTDACKDLGNALDPSHSFFKGQKRCPYNIGDAINWKMHKVVMPVIIPPSFLGEWRVLVSVEMEYEGIMRKQCKYFRGDVHEV